MKRTASPALMTSAAVALAFAGAAAKTADSKPAEGAAKTTKEAPQLTAISTAVALPEKRAAAGGKGSVYPFAELGAPTRDEAGNITAAASFGVKNKTAREMSSIVSNANKKYLTKKRNADGSYVYKTKQIEVAPGQTADVPSTDHEMVAERKFVVYSVDPKTDPEGAQSRVFREI